MYDPGFEIWGSEHLELSFKVGKKLTLETLIDEHANNEFNRYNEYSLGSPHVKTMPCAMLITT